jgi:hypothetical protein
MRHTQPVVAGRARVMVQTVALCPVTPPKVLAAACVGSRSRASLPRWLLA